MALMIIKKVGDKTVIEAKKSGRLSDLRSDGVAVEFDVCATDEEGKYFYVFPCCGKSVGLRLPLEKIEAAFDEALSQMWSDAHVYEINWEFAQQRVSQNGFV